MKFTHFIVLAGLLAVLLGCGKRGVDDFTESNESFNSYQGAGSD